MNFTQMDPVTRQNSVEHLNQRWRQLYELDKEWGERGIQFLFLTNSGGAIATLSFLGAAKDTPNLICLKFSLMAFALGVFFVGISTARTYHRISFLFRSYQDDANKFLKDLVSWEYLIEEDNKRTKPSFLQYIPPYSSFVCFIIGCILGGYSLFGNKL